MRFPRPCRGVGRSLSNWSYSGRRPAVPLTFGSGRPPPAPDAPAFYIDRGGEVGRPTASPVVEVRKAFYVESEETRALSDAELATWRAAHDLSVSGGSGSALRPIQRFQQLPVKPEAVFRLSARYPRGPTPIQAQGWPLAFAGHNMVASAQTGSGKTLAFSLPALIHATSQVNRPDLWCRSLILSPTRELALQTHEHVREFGAIYRCNTACVFGGQDNRRAQMQDLARRPPVVVATPGRLLDFYRAGAIRLHGVSNVVLDEADRMLDMGFEPQVREIIALIHPEAQMLMWTATWPRRVHDLAAGFIRDPVRLRVGSDQIAVNADVRQSFVFCASERDATDKLVAAFAAGSLAQVVAGLAGGGGDAAGPDPKVLIFVATKAMADDVADLLFQHGHRAMSLHSQKSQTMRQRIVQAFRANEASVLVATDIAARGLDIDDITAVFNVGMAHTVEDYVHRIGRTGRAGKRGIAVTFFAPSSNGLVRELVDVLRAAKQDVPRTFLALQQGRGGGSASSPVRWGGARRSKPVLTFGSGRNQWA